MDKITKTYTANDGRNIQVTAKWNPFVRHTDLHISGFKIGEAKGSPSGMKTASHDEISNRSSWPRYVEITYGVEIAEQIQADFKRGELGRVQ